MECTILVYNRVRGCACILIAVWHASAVSHESLNSKRRHYSNVKGASWRLTTLAIQAFVQQFAQAYIREKIKARVTSSSWGESTGDRWFPSQRPVTQKIFSFYDVIMEIEVMHKIVYLITEHPWLRNLVYTHIYILLSMSIMWMWYAHEGFNIISDETPQSRSDLCSKTHIILKPPSEESHIQFENHSTAELRCSLRILLYTYIYVCVCVLFYLR